MKNSRRSVSAAAQKEATKVPQTSACFVVSIMHRRLFFSFKSTFEDIYSRYHKLMCSLPNPNLTDLEDGCI